MDMMKQYHTYLVQFSDLVEPSLINGVSTEIAFDSVEWFLEQHQSFSKLIGNEFDCFTPKGYVETLDHFLSLYDFDPITTILIEYTVSLFMEEINKFIKTKTGKGSQRTNITVLGDAVAIRLMN